MGFCRLMIVNLGVLDWCQILACVEDEDEGGGTWKTFLPKGYCKVGRVAKAPKKADRDAFEGFYFSSQTPGADIYNETEKPNSKNKDWPKRQKKELKNLRHK